MLKIIKQHKPSTAVLGACISPGGETIYAACLDGAIEEMARIAVEVNENTEEIGARRLHTIMERVLDDLSFDASEKAEQAIEITADYVRAQLKNIAEDQDLSRFIL